MAAPKSRLVIGLDFGTTYTGVSYCDEVGARQGLGGIQLMQAWPGLGNDDKVPSRICYSSKDGQPLTLWGNLIRPTVREPVYACMKLKLDEKQKSSLPTELLMALLTGMSIDDINLDDLRSKQADSSMGPDAKDNNAVVADYLTEIRKAVWVELRKRYSTALDTMQKELVVTVPAVWSERAKDLTLKAVHKSGWDANVISLVTEPEAAAVYTLKWMTEGSCKREVEEGDTFVLCDAGGGTVDLISYKVTQVEPSFQLEEAAVGTGDKCGATYVDKEFLSWLESWIGTEAYKKIKPDRLRHGSQLMNSFEKLKSAFGGDDDDMEITLPECGIDTDESLNIESKVLSMKTAQMKQCFDPCVNRTLELVDGQVASIMAAGLGKPKMVFLVGGFGRNTYLYRKIEEYCSQRGIQTRQPTNPWSAVARGAVCRGLEGKSSGVIRVRLSRKHYGCPASEPFDPSVHHPDDHYIDKFTGREMASGQVTWLWEKGDRLPVDNPKTISISVSRNFEIGQQPSAGAVLVSCDDDVAPTRYQDDAVHPVCSVEANFAGIPASRFPKIRNRATGKEYHKVDFKLDATFQNTIITWSLMCDGKQYGSTEVTFDD